MTERSILLLSRYGRNGPSSRVRHYQYLPYLEKAGFSVTVSPFFDEEYINILYRGESRRRYFAGALMRRLREATRAKHYDLIWIEKEALPWCPAWLERCLIPGTRCVMDFDDIWNLRYRQNGNPLIRFTMAHKLEQLAADAAAVVTGNGYIGNWARGAGARNVLEIPSVVEMDRYPISEPPEGPFTIGWIGTPITESYIPLVADALRHLQHNHGARIRLIGASRELAIPGVRFDIVPWSEATEAAELARCHVGIMPLLNAAWDRGKCGYKIIQYMAAGRPVIASKVGANVSIVRHGETGLLVENGAEWIAALERLATDRELVRTLGRAGRRRAEVNYSAAVCAPRLIEMLERVMAQVSSVPEDEAEEFAEIHSGLPTASAGR